MSELTYGELTAILVGLGFVRRIIPGSHVLFAHRPTETIVMLPIARATARVRPANIVSTRFILDAKGIAPHQQWEELVRSHRALRTLPKLDANIAGSNCNCGQHKLIGTVWYVWGPRGKEPLKTVPSCMRLRKRR
jgi:predicted RNA binding protein YcfA (HicA-like mRNA interferase family)